MNLKFSSLLILSLVFITMGCMSSDPGDPGLYESDYYKVVDDYQPDEGGWEHLNASDVVLISDHVLSIEYNSTYQKTKIRLQSSPEAKSIWLSKSLTTDPDDGDLTEKYKVEDVIDFELHIVSLDGTHYETIAEWEH